MRSIGYLAATFAVLVSSAAVAQKRDAPVERPKKPGHVLDPETASANAYSAITKIPWRESLADTKAEAKRSGKLIFWVQMKGKLNGFT